MAKQDCKLCGGTGWTVAEKDGVSSADRCACVAETRVEDLENRSQIPQNYQRASFDNFTVPHDNPGLRAQFKDSHVSSEGLRRQFSA